MIYRGKGRDFIIQLITKQTQLSLKPKHLGSLDFNSIAKG